jgi:uncharacterized membrane protein YeiH
MPLVFSTEIYATVSIVTGAVYYFGLVFGLQGDLVILLAFGIGFPLRVLALIYKWEMPKFVYDRDLR